MENEQQRDAADDHRADNVAPEHRSSGSKGVGDRAAEEAEQRIGDRRDTDGDGSQQCRLRRAIGHERQRDHGDRVAKPTDDLGQPEERKVGGPDVVASGVGFGLKPHERDEEATERKEEVANAVDRMPEAERNDVRQERQPRLGREQDVQRVARGCAVNACENSSVVRHASVDGDG